MKEYIYATDEYEGHWLTGEEIVRCKDCKYIEIGTLKCGRTHLPTSIHDFCSHSKKR